MEANDQILALVTLLTIGKKDWTGNWEGSAADMADRAAGNNPGRSTCSIVTALTELPR
jgi:hypothetical protein